MYSNRQVYTFTQDLPPNPEAIRRRFARMPDANLRMTLNAARELMRESKRETWRVQAELAEEEINRREGSRR